MKLKDKVSIVTGSTSGMGRASAVLFAKEGSKVVVCGRNEERAKAVVAEIKAAGGTAIYVIVDMSNMDGLDIIIDKTIEAFGTVDILYNNAGMLSTTPITEISSEEWTAVMNTNVNASLYLTQKVVPIMKEKGKGVIINTTSVAGYSAHLGFAAYVTSKHAMEGLTKSMAFELGPEIRVNAIAPGAIHTGMVDSIGGVEAIQEMVDAAPLKRVGLPEDIARVALFLATDESSFMTGQSLRVDGGYEV